MHETLTMAMITAAAWLAIFAAIAATPSKRPHQSKY
jgi:hypothetical protein